MNRILLVRLGALGDVVHAIPVAAALRRAFPVGADRLARQREAPRDARSGAGHRSPAGHRRRRSGGGATLLAARARAAPIALRRGDRSAGAAEVGGCSRAARAPSACRLRHRRTCASGWRGRSTPTSTIPAATASTIRAKPAMSSRSTSVCCSRSGSPAAAPEFPIERVDSAVAARRCASGPAAATRCSIPARMAEQALAAVRASAASPRCCASGTG